MITNKRTAAELYKDLQTAMALIKPQIDGEEDGPFLEITIRGLPTALDALQPLTYLPRQIRRH